MALHFFFLFTQYLLRTHYVLGPLPGVENAAGIKTDTSLYGDRLR